MVALVKLPSRVAVASGKSVPAGFRAAKKNGAQSLLFDPELETTPCREAHGEALAAGSFAVDAGRRRAADSPLLPPLRAPPRRAAWPAPPPPRHQAARRGPQRRPLRWAAQAGAAAAEGAFGAAGSRRRSRRAPVTAARRWVRQPVRGRRRLWLRRPLPVHAPAPRVVGGPGGASHRADGPAHAHRRPAARHVHGARGL